VGCEPHGTRTTEETIWNFAGFNNPYITTKLLAELEAMRWAARGLPLCVVNPCAPVGEGDVKPTPTGTFVLLLISGWLPLAPSVKFPTVDIRDVSRCHALALEKGRVGERYICAGETIEFDRMGRILRELVGSRAPLRLPGWMTRLAAGATWLLPQFASTLTGVARFALFDHDLDATKSVRELGMTYGPVEAALGRAALYFEERGWVKLKKRPSAS
jgi:dihydroflavonol-4-reductase